MKKVRLLTIQEKDNLIGQLYCASSYFNPLQDCNDNWFISNEEVNECIYPQFSWINNLPEIDYCKKENTSITGLTGNT